MKTPAPITAPSPEGGIGASISNGLCVMAAALILSLSGTVTLRAQMSPEEHASHHPGGQTEASPAPASAPERTMGGGSEMGNMGGMGPPAGAKGEGGGMGGMGKMMEGMGKPPPKELYPTLMALPELSPEQRKLVQEQADERMHSGTVLMGQAFDALNAATQSGDYAAMHEATATLREGTAQFESGVAARRALAEGRVPREVALSWFKREMNLPPGDVPVAPGLFGVTPFHLFTMVLLVAFALAMVAMYFLKMRRAAALFGRIEAGKGAPPPGSAPELAGGKPPSNDKPPDGDKPPPGGTPSPGGLAATVETCGRVDQPVVFSLDMAWEELTELLTKVPMPRKDGGDGQAQANGETARIGKWLRTPLRCVLRHFPIPSHGQVGQLSTSATGSVLHER